MFIGMVVQQLLLLPSHPSRPTPLPFRVKHTLLCATRCSYIDDKKYGTGYKPIPSGIVRSPEEKREVAKRLLAKSFDPAWLEHNASLFHGMVQNIGVSG